MEAPAKTEYSATLRVTDRGLDRYREFVRFVPETLSQNAMVVNVGGGENQTFEKELTSIRPDVKIFTIDPSIYSQTAVHEVDQDALRSLTEDESYLRVKSLPNKDRTLVAFGQKMPFKSDSVDVILDVHAASQWAANLESYKEFLKESMRVLKVGGKLYIGNVYFGDPLLGDEASEVETIKQARDVFDSLNLDTDVFLSTERIRTNDEGVKIPDKRVCAIVTKY